ncbi:SLATT domain-containing protein [Stenotrophomonas sp. TWI809]|uniref:SLATT domain-containing protein n=1 Tax=Stenotrophomonas sp. TWI809 TaxID=3136796 RepID=UPI00320A0107
MEGVENRIDELIRRTRITTRSRYRASERLERHHKFSQWTVSLISAALVFVPMMQAFNIQLGVDAIYLNATQAVLAVLVLVYSLLLGQENFISRSEAMHRNGVELGRFARKLAGISGSVRDQYYIALTEEYYDILEKYGNHKPIDYLLTQLTEKPSTGSEWLTYVARWLKARVVTILIFSHYFVAMTFVGYVFFKLFLAIRMVE